MCLLWGRILFSDVNSFLKLLKKDGFPPSCKRQYSVQSDTDSAVLCTEEMSAPGQGPVTHGSDTQSPSSSSSSYDVPIDFVAGSLGATASVYVGQPLDTLKVGKYQKREDFTYIPYDVCPFRSKCKHSPNYIRNFPHASNRLYQKKELWEVKKSRCRFII